MKKNQKNQSSKKATILIVEDESNLNKSISTYLESYGYTTISAFDGQDGWEQFKKNKPDLVITDLLLPGLHGFDLSRDIKKEDASIPIIIMSAVYKSALHQLEARGIGAEEFLEKPLRFDSMLAKIKNVLTRSKEQMELQFYRNIADSLKKENEILNERLKRFSEIKGGGLAEKEVEKYRAICGAIAHELKSEFLHIGYSLKEIREAGNALPEILEESDIVERSIAYSQLLMQRLLNFIDMGTLQREPIELSELIKKTEALARPRLSSNIQLIINTSIKKQKISANLEQLMGVLLELINNASEVLREKGGTIEIKAEKKNRKVGISVKDNGPGVSPDLMTILLKEQVPSKSGLGLGLYLCNKVITEFGGELIVKTTTGKGTTFSIVLPITDIKKEP